MAGKRKTAQRGPMLRGQPEPPKRRYEVILKETGKPVYHAWHTTPVEKRGFELDKAERLNESLVSETMVVPAFVYYGFNDPEAETEED